MNDFNVETPAESAEASVVQDFGAARLVLMNEPRRKNALSLDLREALQNALTEALDTPEVRAVVLAGAGGAFSAGGDITTAKSLNPVVGRPRLQRIHGLFRQLYNGPKPVVAAVEGAAVGAGLRWPRPATSSLAPTTRALARRSIVLA